MSRMTAEDYRTVRRILADSFPVKIQKTSTVAWFGIGALCGFLWGFFLAVRFF